jgi:hypothetical protein
MFPYSGVVFSSDCESGVEDGVDEHGASKTVNCVYKHGCPHRSPLCETFIRLLDHSKGDKTTARKPLGTNVENGNKDTLRAGTAGTDTSRIVWQMACIS